MPLGKRGDGRTVGPSSAQRAVNARRAAEAPLRAVVASGTGLDAEYPHGDRDVCECGHILRAASDLIGRRYPARRRCKKCASGKPRDLTEQDIQALIDENK